MTGASLNSRNRRRFASAGRLLLPTVWAITLAVPFFYLVVISLRTRHEFAVDPLGLTATPAWANYAEAWNRGDFLSAFVNNVIVSVVTVLGVVVVGSLAGYAIARWRGRGGNVIYVFFVFGLIVPFQLGIPMLYRIWAQIGLVDTLAGVIIIHIATSLPFAIFLYAGFLLTVPHELEESARVDGASEARTFVSIVFPLLRPATATVVIISSISVWNDLLVALFFLQSAEKQTLGKATIGLMNTFNSDVPVVFAAAVITVLPIIVLFISLQRFFISGLTQGALRG
ncbi:raffinose/stachyose/melibiose transport system permease protein [Microbacterium natoriense]|uniref:Raffinose/stachyose/melibiose transport system permease protein n=1 Tax=Microbacterium natoriense TaxID=284570 RepID=A0AAW8ESE1_9MICO|nr:carbohydrate ABC transporter permease [Microbacterium natoriense]MDQ0646221.1 raffinose/stachyose/melibiose transport system permease protein [Microbacterium natoriense]